MIRTDLERKLFEALKAAVAVAAEARQEWDAAPEGMRAGKLLIALEGKCRGYRYTTDMIHDVLLEAERCPPFPQIP